MSGAAWVVCGSRPVKVSPVDGAGTHKKGSSFRKKLKGCVDFESTVSKEAILDMVEC